MPEKEPQLNTRGPHKRKLERAGKAAQRTSTLSVKTAISGAIAIAIAAAAILVVGPESAKNNTAPSLNSELNGLDLILTKSPQDLNQYAQRIALLAADAVCQELGCNPQEFTGDFVSQHEDDFVKTRQQSGCPTNPQILAQAPAYTDPTKKQIYLNLDRALYQNRLTRQLWLHPASAALIIDMHEILHDRAPVITPTSPEFITDNETHTIQSVSQVRGLVAIVSLSDPNRPGVFCTTTYRNPIEEAVVQDKINRWVAKLGIRNDMVIYPEWVAKYNSKVLLPLFGGDNRPLFNLQQRSQDQDFFRLIGEKLGFPAQYQAREGENYLGALFIAGDRLGY